MNKKRYGIIYCIRNTINNKMYFGQTTETFDQRYRNGIQNTHNEHLKKSIDKYGIENFEIDKEFDIAYSKEELDKLENMYIIAWNTFNSTYGYNKTYGGSSSGKHTEETRNKISKSLKGKMAGEKHPMYGKHRSEETKIRIGEGNKGKIMPKESLQKRSKNVKEKGTFKGKNNPMYGKTGNLSPSYGITGEKHPMYGKHHTKETREKISIKLKGKHKSQETKEKMKKNNSKYWLGKTGPKHPSYGKCLSEETKNKISETQKNNYKNNKHVKKDKKIICITTNDILNSIKEAGTKYNVSCSSITACCRGKLKSAGKNTTGEKLIWMYYDEYLTLSSEDISKKIENSNTMNNNSIKNRCKKIICLNNHKIFNSIMDASKFYKIDRGHISHCCNGKQKTAGKLPDGTKLKWMFYDEYLKLNK